MYPRIVTGQGLVVNQMMEHAFLYNKSTEWSYYTKFRISSQNDTNIILYNPAGKSRSEYLIASQSKILPETADYSWSETKIFTGEEFSLVHTRSLSTPYQRMLSDELGHKNLFFVLPWGQKQIFQLLSSDNIVVFELHTYDNYTAKA